MQRCKLFKQCWNLPAGHCGAVVQAVEMGSEPTSLALSSRGAGCLSGVSFYLQRLDGQNWIYCSTFILGLIKLSLGTCNCFCLGVPSFFF